MTGSLIRSRREHELASDVRAGRWARGKARRAHREYVREHWPYLLVATVVCLVITAAVALVVRVEVARGIVIGLGVAGTGGVLTHWIVLVTGTGPSMMGDLAEQWTASELRRLRRDGWRLVNHVYLAAGNIDHVILGPSGVVVVETKWSASPWVDAGHLRRIDRAVDQVHRNAKQLALWSDFRRIGMPEPRSVVVLWGVGAVQRALPDGAVVLPGARLADWVRTLPVDRGAADKTAAAWDVLEARARERDPVEAAASPLPPSVHSLVTMVVSSVVVGLLAFVAAGEAMRAVHPLVLWLATALVMGAGPWLLRRRRSLRPCVTGWQAGIALTILLVFASPGQVLLR